MNYLEIKDRISQNNSYYIHLNSTLETELEIVCIDPTLRPISKIKKYFFNTMNSYKKQLKIY